MKIHPAIDQRFEYASPFLKRMLSCHRDKLINGNCLDLPSGNGRNTFLLASYFGYVKAVDINVKFLKAIEANEPAYVKQGKIQTLNADLLTAPFLTQGFGFICNIHFWHEVLISGLLNDMSPGALLLIETPGCHGANYKLLPNRAEITMLFSGLETIAEEFTICKHPDNNDKRGPLKLLVRK